jgi:hypothetical protein
VDEKANEITCSFACVTFCTSHRPLSLTRFGRPLFRAGDLLSASENFKLPPTLPGLVNIQT